MTGGLSRTGDPRGLSGSFLDDLSPLGPRSRMESRTPGGLGHRSASCTTSSPRPRWPPARTTPRTPAGPRGQGLGAARCCGPFNGYEVGSPLNWLMNASRWAGWSWSSGCFCWAPRRCAGKSILLADERGAIERIMAYPVILRLSIVGLVVACRVRAHAGGSGLPCAPPSAVATQGSRPAGNQTQQEKHPARNAEDRGESHRPDVGRW